MTVDSFGFAAESVPCSNGERRTARIKNFHWWVSVPADAAMKLRYRELFRTRAGDIIVQDVLGGRTRLGRVIPDYSLHMEKPE